MILAVLKTGGAVFACFFSQIMERLEKHPRNMYFVGSEVRIWHSLFTD